MAGLELFSAEGFRQDGRRPNELRKIECNTSVLPHADGSAYIQHGSTKVLAAVFGPHEPKNRSRVLESKAFINCEIGMATFSTGERRVRVRGDRRTLEIGIHLRNVFDSVILTDLYAKSQIDIFVEVLQLDGGHLAACINAASLALLDAGVALRDVVTSCSATWAADLAMVDCSNVEETSGHAPCLTVALLPRTGHLALVDQSSRVHINHLAALVDVAVDGASDVYAVLDKYIRRRTMDALTSVVDSGQSHQATL